MPVRRITARFDITTPMFLGGADGGAEALFRVASWRGALRFWWRALAYPRFHASAGAPGPALAALREAEARLFGRADCGQGALLLELDAPAKLTLLATGSVLQDGRRTVGPGARYLGYGLMVAFGDAAGTLQRSCIGHGQSVTIRVLAKPGLADDAFRGVIDAITALGLLGGLGSRARRGYGSLSLAALSGDGVEAFAPPETPEAYAAAVKAILPALAGADPMPPFSALGGNSRITILTRPINSALSAADKVGQQMQRYRSWGLHGQVNGAPSEKRFQDDHDWSKDPRGASFATFVPKRVVFGLPQNYGQNFGVRPRGADRRASPLLLHIHRLGEAKFIAVATVLPARFLADEPTNTVEVFGRGPVSARPGSIDWSVLTQFIDGAGPPAEPPAARTPYFPDRQAVLP